MCAACLHCKGLGVAASLLFFLLEGVSIGKAFMMQQCDAAWQLRVGEFS
jgi:hypothetical protein